MSKKLTELDDLQALEVSTVKAGANKKKRFPIFKQESLMSEEIIKAVLETEFDEESKLEDWVTKSKLSDKAAGAAKGALRLMLGFKEELPKNTFDTLATIAGMAKAKQFEEEEEEELKEKKKKKSKDMTDKMNKSLEALPTEVKAHFEAVTKAQNEQIETLKKQNEKVEKALKDAQDQRELAEWIDKAESDLSGFPGKSTEELGKMLKDLHDLSPEIAKSQFETMKKAASVVKKSAMFNELGGRGHSYGGSAMDEIQKAAKEIRKSDPKMTKAEAETQAMLNNPELYTEYMREHPEQGRV